MIEAEALKSPVLRHGFFTRQGGFSQGLYASLNCGMGSGDDKEVVRKNREIAAGGLDVEEPNLVTVYQVHSPEVVTVTHPFDLASRPKADAMVTNVPGLAIGVLTADCGPILFADIQRGVIGAAHAGWKGALTGVTASTLDAMEKLGAKRADVVAVVGPMIQAKSYEVGPEFPQHFIANDDCNRRFFMPSPRPGHSMFDLAGYVEARVKREGAGQVVNLGHCTCSEEERFFSYRRATHRAEPAYGRQISAIALVRD